MKLTQSVSRNSTAASCGTSPKYIFNWMGPLGPCAWTQTRTSIVITGLLAISYPRPSILYLSHLSLISTTISALFSVSLPCLGLPLGQHGCQWLGTLVESPSWVHIVKACCCAARGTNFFLWSHIAEIQLAVRSHKECFAGRRVAGSLIFIISPVIAGFLLTAPISGA